MGMGEGSLTASPQLALSCHGPLALDIASKAHACSWPGARSVAGRSVGRTYPLLFHSGCRGASHSRH